MIITPPARATTTIDCVKEARDCMNDRGIMCVFGPGICTHVYLLLLLMAMWHYIRPLCEGKRIIPGPVLHFLIQRKRDRCVRLGWDAERVRGGSCLYKGALRRSMEKSASHGFPFSFLLADITYLKQRVFLSSELNVIGLLMVLTWKLWKLTCLSKVYRCGGEWGEQNKGLK